MAGTSLPLRHHVTDISSIAAAVPQNVTNSEESTSHAEAERQGTGNIFHDELQPTWPFMPEATLAEPLIPNPMAPRPATETEAVIQEPEPFLYSSEAMPLSGANVGFEGSLAERPWDAEAFSGLLESPLLPVPFEAALHSEQDEFLLQFPLGSVYGTGNSADYGSGMLGRLRRSESGRPGHEQGCEGESNEAGAGDAANPLAQQFVFFNDGEYVTEYTQLRARFRWYEGKQSSLLDRECLNARGIGRFRMPGERSCATRPCTRSTEARTAACGCGNPLAGAAAAARRAAGARASRAHWRRRRVPRRAFARRVECRHHVQQAVRAAHGDEARAAPRQRAAAARRAAAAHGRRARRRRSRRAAHAARGRAACHLARGATGGDATCAAAAAAAATSAVRAANGAALRGRGRRDGAEASRAAARDRLHHSAARPHVAKAHERAVGHTLQSVEACRWRRPARCRTICTTVSCGCAVAG
ncbi:plectin [Gracilaria domingensis]|nr:plectin [Gracilaria domingensis]